MKNSEKDGISPVPRRRVGEGLAKEELGGSLEGVGLPRRSLKGGAGAELNVGMDVSYLVSLPVLSGMCVCEVIHGSLWRRI